MASATLKEVKDLVALQQRLASECKVGFYNFYEAMGGEQSMKKLVDRNLANKDYPISVSVVEGR